MYMQHVTFVSFGQALALATGFIFAFAGTSLCSRASWIQASLAVSKRTINLAE